MMMVPLLEGGIDSDEGGSGGQEHRGCVGRRVHKAEVEKAKTRKGWRTDWTGWRQREGVERLLLLTFSWLAEARESGVVGGCSEAVSGHAFHAEGRHMCWS